MHLFEGELGHHAASIGGAIEGGVVNDDGLTVPGEAHVQLKRVGPLFEAEPKSFEGVLRRLSRGAAVGDDEPAAWFDERIAHR